MLNTVTERLSTVTATSVKTSTEVAVLRKNVSASACMWNPNQTMSPKICWWKYSAAYRTSFPRAPQFYTLQQLLNKGRSMEEIFEGRPFDLEKDDVVQKNGFIDTRELEALARHRVIRFLTSTALL